MRRISRATATAFVLTLAIAGQSLAASWGTPSIIATVDPNVATYPTGLSAVGDDTLVATYVVGGQVFTRRSTDNGATWATPVLQSPPGGFYSSDIASYGSFVDLAIGSVAVRYARSTDGGATFSESIPLSNDEVLTPPRIAHGPDGLVAAVWARWNYKPRLFIRISHDDGATWDPAQVLRLKTGSEHFDVAIGDGMIYVVVGTAKGMLLRRSADGATWTDWRRLGDFENIGLGKRVLLEARGNEAVVSYMHATDKGILPAYRRTLDAGVTWSSRKRLSAPGHVTAPVFSIDDGGTRATFSRQTCAGSVCTLNVFYRQLGVSGWTSPELVSASPQYWSWPAGVAYTNRPAVIYLHFKDQWTPDAAIEVRSRPNP